MIRLFSFFTPAFVPGAHTQSALDSSKLAAYHALAQKVGVPTHSPVIEEFKCFLNDNQITTYPLDRVVRYMDIKAERHNKHRTGWCWCPLREKDRSTHGKIEFGTAHRRETFNHGFVTTLSDYFHNYDAPLYTHRVPMHALEKIALIEDKFQKPVAFLVSDYAAKDPDPFLMAIVHNELMRQGEGRFVIDFWDEPGFGIKSA